MEYVQDETAEDRLYLKALGIKYEGDLGLWVPIMQRLALRGHAGAMVELADWYSGDDKIAAFGQASDPFSAAGLYLRATRKGFARAAKNAAASCFNRNDLVGYRRWLRLAANAGSEDAGRELRRFETRLPHTLAGKIRRLRPKRRWTDDL